MNFITQRLTARVNMRHPCRWQRNRFLDHAELASYPSPASRMSHPNPTTPSSPKFQLIFNNALDTYKKRTKNDLLTHPLVVQLQSCTSSSAVLALIHQQLQGLQTDDDRLTRWLDPTVRVLYAFSETLGEGVSLVCLRK
jgi:hypothetical protein